MAAQEWSFASYLANIEQGIPAADQKHSNSGYSQNIEDQRIFTELKPPCSKDLTSTEGNNCGDEAMLRFDGSNSGAMTSIFVPNVFGPQTCKSELQAKSEYSEDIIEQQLISWDLNRLVTLGDDAIIGSVVDDDDLPVVKDEENWEVDGESAFELFSKANLNLQFNCSVEAKEDDFQFPQCVEEEFRQLILRANKSEEWKCTKCGGIAPRRDQSKVQSANRDFNATSGLESSDPQNVKCESGLNFGSKDDSDAVAHASRSQASQSTKPGTAVYTDSVLTSQGTQKHFLNSVDAGGKIEDIDKVLTHIDPGIDVLGKTFHKIPSTQPIYCDEEPREDENGNDYRIKRPMNAFMLWARKYRSLVAKEFSEASNSEISVKLGEIWNELTSDQQRPYFKKAESLKTQHKQSYPNYVYQPRQTTPKLTRKGKSSMSTKDNKIAVNTLPANFGTPFAFFCSTKAQATESEKDTTGNATEQRKTIIMAPKPIYPVGFFNRQLDDTATHKTQNQTGENIGVVERNNGIVKRGGLLQQKNSPGRNVDLGNTSRQEDAGLVKDAMMPRLEKPGDESDVMGSDFVVLNTSAFDEFLSGGSENLAEYLDSCLMKHTQEKIDSRTGSEKGKRKGSNLKGGTRKRRKDEQSNRN